MQEVIMEFMNQFGYLGVALLICVENVFPPIPSEVILIFGGFMTTKTTMEVWWVVVAATVGSAIGAVILYGLGRVLKKERLKKLFSSKVGRVLGLKPEYVDKADTWFGKYEYKAVLICRCIPIVRSFISVPAGISKMKFLPFIGLTILGSGVWNTVLVWMGVLAGDAWEKWVDYVGVYSKVALVFFGIVFILAGIWFLKQKKENKL